MRLAGSTKIEWDPEKQVWFRRVWVIFKPGYRPMPWVLVWDSVTFRWSNELAGVTYIPEQHYR